MLAGARPGYLVVFLVVFFEVLLGPVTVDFLEGFFSGLLEVTLMELLLARIVGPIVILPLGIRTLLRAVIIEYRKSGIRAQAQVVCAKRGSRPRPNGAHHRHASEAEGRTQRVRCMRGLARHR